MLQITIPAQEAWDEQKEEFVSIKSYTLRLEHSLVSISKWEAKHNKPFISNKELTPDEIIDYVRCMSLVSNANEEVYRYLTQDNIKEITDYIAAPMTATWFSDKSARPTREVITSELIYYWMFSFNIPIECQKWHLNRLLTLIRVCNIKNTPPKKMSKSEIMRRNSALNAARKAKYHTKG